jgi:hypothetical protein
MPVRIPHRIQHSEVEIFSKMALACDFTPKTQSSNVTSTPQAIQCERRVDLRAIHQKVSLLTS